MAKKKRLSEKKLKELKAARKRVLVWAFREIAFLYQLRAVSELKNIADKMPESEAKDQAARIELVTYGHLHYVYLTVADTILQGEAGPKFNVAAARLPELLAKANSVEPETPYVEVRNELRSIVSALCDAQSELPIAYVCMSHHPEFMPVLRKFGGAYCPRARTDSKVIPDSMVNVLFAVIEGCRKALHGVQSKDREKGQDWTAVNRYQKMVAILTKEVSDLLKDRTTFSHLSTSLQVLEIIEN